MLQARSRPMMAIEGTFIMTTQRTNSWRAIGQEMLYSRLGDLGTSSPILTASGSPDLPWKYRIRALSERTQLRPKLISESCNEWENMGNECTSRYARLLVASLVRVRLNEEFRKIIVQLVVYIDGSIPRHDKSSAIVSYDPVLLKNISATGINRTITHVYFR